MAEDGRGMAFSLEADYEDGEFGDDGEFYGRKRTKRKLSRDEQTYGVFMEDGHRVKRGAVPVRPSKSMFVSGGVLGGSAEQDGEDKAPADDADKNGEADATADKLPEDSKYGFLARDSSSEDENDDEKLKDVELPRSFGAKQQRSNIASGKQERSRMDETRRAEEPRQPSTAEYGIGSKLMAMMGFKGGGLGKDGSGITKAVEANVRAGRSGLGTEEDRARRAPPPEDKEAAPKPKKAPATKPKKWRKASPSAVPIDMRDEAVDMQTEEDKPEVTRPLIIDMRGSSAKVVDNLSDALGQKASIQESFLPELAHFVRLAADVASSDGATLLSRAEAESERRKMLMASTKKLKDKASKTSQQKLNCEGLAVLYHELAKAQSPRDIADLTKDMWQRYRTEFTACSVSKGVMAAMSKVARRASDQEALVAAHLTVRTALDDLDYVRLVCRTFVAPMQRTLLSPNFGPSSQEAVIQDVEVWRPAVPDELAELFFKNILVPALVKGAEKWTEKEGMDPHVTLFQWLPILGKKNLSALFSRLSHRFGRSLAARPWREVVNAVAPWKDVLPKDKMVSFMTRHVAPIMEKRMSDKLLIDPAGENRIEVFDDLRDYTELAGTDATGRIMYAVFMPKWLRVLRSWLSDPEADVTEVGNWYKSWTKTLDERFGSRMKLIKAGKTVALDLMKLRMDGGNVSKFSVRDALQAKERSAAVGRDKDKPAKNRTDSVKGSMGVRDVVQQYAAANGITFKSAQRQTKDGRTLYLFGKVLVFFDNTKDLVCAQRGAGKEDFEPVHISELLELNAARG